MSGWRYSLSEVQLDDQAIEACLEALRSNWLTMGPRTGALEQAWAERFARAHGVAVSSAAAGLHLACRASGVGEGDQVIFAALGSLAAAHAPHWCGGEAVPADIGALGTPLIDAAGVEARLSERTKAVIVDHAFGHAVELDQIASLCEQHGIALIEDCSASTGAAYADGRLTGSRGDLSVYSLSPDSITPAGQGGVVLTDDEEAGGQIRLWRSHAMTTGTWDRHRGHAETYDVVDLGYNYRIDEPRAAIALAQLAGLDDSLAARRKIVAAYSEALRGVEGVEIPFSAEQAGRSSPVALPVLVADRATRDAVRSGLAERGIETGARLALTQLEIYREAGRRHPCPLAAEFADRHLTLPLSDRLSPEDVLGICAELADAVVTAHA